mmetsp:Transcript_10343/g.25055  ORF Transcript_10343/g.25055 Transcript_10343/m.25055 type:complete len:86 (-) Transcript_10343:50-307(-)
MKLHREMQRNLIMENVTTIRQNYVDGPSKIFSPREICFFLWCNWYSTSGNLLYFNGFNGDHISSCRNIQGTSVFVNCYCLRGQEL